MKVTKIILICVTALLLLASVVAALNMDWGDKDLPDPPKNNNVDTDSDSDVLDKATVHLTDRIATTAYFEDFVRNPYTLVEGLIDPVTIRASTSEAQDIICVSTDEFYSSVYRELYVNAFVELEAGKTYYFWFITEDPNY